MTNLIWMLTWLPHVLSAMHELPKPINVNLSSSHFIHLLTWEPGPGSPSDVHYNVSVYSRTGRTWEPVAGCEHVERPLVCNLTEAFPVLEQVYYNQVTAVLGDQVSKSAYTEGFLPIKDTRLDLPLLTVVPCARALCVELQPPVERLRKIYDSFDYKLNVQSSSGDGAQFVVETKSLKGETLKDLAPGRKYCVSVRFSDSLASRESNYSQPQCALAAADYTADIEISVVVCLMVVILLLCLALLVRAGFFCQKWSLPLILTSIKHNREVTATLCDGPLSFPVHVESAAPSTGEKENRKDLEDDSDGEPEEEDTSGSGGRGYELRAAANPLSSSSSSSSSSWSYKTGGLRSSYPDYHSLVPPSKLCTSDSDRPYPQLNPHLVLGEPQTESSLSAGVRSETGSNRSLTPRASSPSVHVPELSRGRESGPHCPTDTWEKDTVTVEGIELAEEAEGSAGRRDVNLFSLTFGRHLGFLVEEPTSPCNTAPLLPPQTRDTEEVAMETVTTSVAEEEYSGYMSRT